jgi:hypothetical protein
MQASFEQNRPNFGLYEPAIFGKTAEVPELSDREPLSI